MTNRALRPSMCLAMAFLLATSGYSQISGVYKVYGTGCSGSGLQPAGVVLPAGYDQRYGNSANCYPFGIPNMRYMQAHEKSELPAAALIRGMKIRHRVNEAQPAYSLTMDLYCGYTSDPTGVLVSQFASNWNGTPTNVFSGRLDVPAFAAQNNPANWTLTIPFKTPYIYTQSRGSFLWECVNSTPVVFPLVYYDSVAIAGVKTWRLWAHSSTASSGSLGRNIGIVIQLDSPHASGAIVNLTNTGVPSIRQSFSVDFYGAVQNSSAVLWLGTSLLSVNLGSLLPGCTLYTSLDVILGIAPTGSSGAGSLKITLPAQQSLVGVRFFNQWMVIDRAANGLGIVLSNGGAATIGG
ncbi:MAG: hypothetical protein KDC95_22485 [Planctomycetes bacterium]|nr:hypothetical protein [Planctomycetota bacterium]